MTTPTDPSKVALRCALEAAFAHRPPPVVMTAPTRTGTDEHHDAQALQGMDARQAAFDTQVAKHLYGAFFGLTPEAFCHWLPAVLRAALNTPDSATVWPPVVDALIGQLDRGLGSEGWDSFFSDRFRQLEFVELRVLQDWVLWLSSSGAGSYDQDQLERAYGTLEQLSEARRTAPK